ncbi:MAG: preprotein translocase subunit SecE [Deltaproteobacteria bacterium]|nr:preprotein translocase subunit SecE [Deltaproteobacteria bacterium]
MAKPKNNNEKSSTKSVRKPSEANSVAARTSGGEVSDQNGANNKKEKGQVKASAKRAKPGPAKPNFIDKARHFLREVKIELKKVTWPSRKEAAGTTAVVLVLVAILSIYLGIVDAGLTSALTSLMR